jgi:hypothetical protein
LEFGFSVAIVAIPRAKVCDKSRVIVSMTEMTPFIRLAGAFLVRSMDPDYSDGVIGSLWMIESELSHQTSISIFLFSFLHIIALKYVC